MAILPGVAMAELWQMIASIENVLRAIGILVLISSLFGLSTMLLASMHQRKNEIAVLRVLGAGPIVIFTLVQLEALILVVLAIITALGMVYLSIIFATDWLASHYGLFLNANLLDWQVVGIIGVTIIATLATSAIPAFEAYKNALHSTLSGR